MKTLTPETRHLTPRRLLVPFTGSGSEMIGALQAGWDDVVGIEQDAHYCRIARARLKHHTAQGSLYGPPVARARVAQAEPLAVG